MCGLGGWAIDFGMCCLIPSSKRVETCDQRTDCHSGTEIGKLRCFDDGKVARLSLLLVRAVGS